MLGERKLRTVVQLQPSTCQWFAAALNSNCPTASRTTQASVSRIQRAGMRRWWTKRESRATLPFIRAAASLARSRPRPRTRNRVRDKAGEKHDRRLPQHEREHDDDEQHHDERHASLEIERLEAPVLQIAHHRKTRENRREPRPPAKRFGIVAEVVDDPHEAGDQRRGGWTWQSGKPALVGNFEQSIEACEP